MYDFLILRHSHSCIALKNAITYFLLKVYLPPDSVWYTEKQVESGTITVESGQVRYTEKQVESEQSLLSQVRSGIQRSRLSQQV